MPAKKTKLNKAQLKLNEVHGGQTFCQYLQKQQKNTGAAIYLYSSAIPFTPQRQKQ